MTPPTPERPARPISVGDRWRAVAVATGAGAMIGIPLLGPVLAGTSEGADEFDTEITPPDYAFTVWAPIFAATAANAVQHTIHPDADVNRRTGWWLAAAFSTIALWSVAAQSGRFRYTPYILGTGAALTGIGYARAQRPAAERRSDLIPATSAGLLFGWISIASVVNTFATRRRGTFSTTTRTGRRRARTAVAVAATALSGLIAASRHGSASLAATSGWAFLTSAANSERTRTTRIVTAGAATLVTTAAAAKATLQAVERKSRH